jgi:hypothetical protein
MGNVPPINPIFIRDSGSSDYCWSSSVGAYDNTAWVVNFWDGTSTSYGITYSHVAARCVR